MTLVDAISVGLEWVFWGWLAIQITTQLHERAHYRVARRYLPADALELVVPLVPYRSALVRVFWDDYIDRYDGRTNCYISLAPLVLIPISAPFLWLSFQPGVDPLPSFLLFILGITWVPSPADLWIAIQAIAYELGYAALTFDPGRGYLYQFDVPEHWEKRLLTSPLPVGPDDFVGGSA